MKNTKAGADSSEHKRAGVVSSTATSSNATRKMEEQRPKRPLSAFNLFYRFKRSKILQAHNSSSAGEGAGDGDASAKEEIRRLISTVPGLEDLTPDHLSSMSPERRRDVSRSRIRSALGGNLAPKDTRERLHRRSHGCMTFVEMSRIMSASWRGIDKHAKGVFEELAGEGRRMYQKRCAEYERKRPPGDIRPSSSANKNGQTKSNGGGGSAAADKSEEKRHQEGVSEAGPRGEPGKDDYIDIAPKAAKTTKPGDGEDKCSDKARPAIRRSSSAASTNTNSGTPARPKRPLSAYNLFYRFKRARILRAFDSSDDSEATIRRLIAAVPGLEDYDGPTTLAGDAPGGDDGAREVCRREIRGALERNLAPNETRERLHRKSHGRMSFVEMSKIMCDSWKSIDPFTKSVFEELAQEGRRMYHKRVGAYEKENPAPRRKARTLNKSNSNASNGSTGSLVAKTKKMKLENKRVIVTDQFFKEEPFQDPFKDGTDPFGEADTEQPAAASAITKDESVSCGTPMVPERRISPPSVSLTGTVNVPVPKDAPTDMSSVLFGIEMEPLPIFPNIFEPDESNAVQRILMNATVSPSRTSNNTPSSHLGGGGRESRMSVLPLSDMEPLMPFHPTDVGTRGGPHHDEHHGYGHRSGHGEPFEDDLTKLIPGGSGNGILDEFLENIISE